MGLDGPSIPPAAVAEFEIDEIDHGLLQDIRRSSSCEQIEELAPDNSLPVLSPPPRLGEPLP